MVVHFIILTIIVVVCNIWRYNRENDGDDYEANIEPRVKYIEAASLIIKPVR